MSVVAAGKFISVLWYHFFLCVSHVSIDCRTVGSAIHAHGFSMGMMPKQFDCKLVMDVFRHTPPFKINTNIASFPVLPRVGSCARPAPPANTKLIQNESHKSMTHSNWRGCLGGDERKK